MRLVSVLLALVVIAAGSATAYYFWTVDIPVASSEHGGHGHGGEEHGEDDGHGHGSEEKGNEHSKEDGHDHGGGESGGAHNEDDGHGHGADEKEEAHSKDDGHGHGAEVADTGHTEEDGHEHGAEEHGHDDGAQHAEIDEATARKHGLEFDQAGPAILQNALSLPGEVALNANRVVHVVPRLTGVTRQVTKNIGDTVEEGELLAVIDSRELAELKSSLLAATERRELAQIRYSREKELFEKKITPADDYLSAKQALAEESINIRSAEQQLIALGVTPEAMTAMGNQKNNRITDYPIISPITGKIIEKHLNLGEYVDAQADAFVIADLSSVWVSIVVYAADLKNIRQGQTVVVRSEDLDLEAKGRVAYIGALVGEETRTATATVEMPNPEGLWLPGLFVSVAVAQDQFEVPLAVPVDAIQILKEDKVVFVREGDALEARPVTLGRTDGKMSEITGGLTLGETYVAKNSFLVKADIEKAGAAHEH